MAATRVLLFVPTFEGGGAERVMVELSAEFARQGLAVTLAVVDADGPLRSRVDPSVEVAELGAESVLTACVALARLIRTLRPTGMLSALSHANVAATIARKLSGSTCRLVCSEHANLSQTLATYGGWKLHVTKFALRLALRDCDAIVTVSQGVADDLQRTLGLPSNRIQTIYNPVVSGRLLAASRELVEHPWLASREIPCVVAVGRLTPQKDFSTLLRAIGLLRTARPVRLLILGKGEMRDALAHQAVATGIADAVDFLGYVENPYPYMAAASVFVLSSSFEGLGNVLIEALACGAPVVSTDCPSGPAEILQGGQWGRLIPVGDAAAMAVAIADTLERPRRADGRIRAGDFTVEHAASKYRGLLLGEQGEM